MNYWKSISKLYDREIYKQCEQSRVEVIECMRNSFNDDFTCKEIIRTFEECTHDFDREFRKHYVIDRRQNDKQH